MSASMIERIAEGQAKFDGRSLIGMPRGERERYFERARIALEDMRELSMESQMAGCAAQSMCSIELDGPLKKHEDCETPDDWMQRGHGFAKRMMSGQEFMAGWNGAIDAILNEMEN